MPDDDFDPHDPENNGVDPDYAHDRDAGDR